MARSKVELFEQIRRDRRVEELSIRELAQRHRVHRRTVRQELASAVPPPRKAYASRSRPAIDPYIEVIDSWLRTNYTDSPTDSLDATLSYNTWSSCIKGSSASRMRGSRGSSPYFVFATFSRTFTSEALQRSRRIFSATLVRNDGTRSLMPM